MICSFPRQSDSWVFDGLYRAGQDRARGRAAGQPRRADAGRRRRHRRVLHARPASARRWPRARRRATIDGRDYVLEYPIRGDVALIKAPPRPTAMGNLVYRKTARNFGPVMADRRDARRSSQVAEVVARRRLDPEVVVTPGIYVDRVVVAGRPPATARGPVTHRRASDRGPLDRDELAALVARRHPAPASFVNLGIGQPTLVADYLRPDAGVVLHTENGMLGMGPAARRRRDRPRPDQRRQGPGHRAARARRTSTTPTPSR